MELLNLRRYYHKTAAVIRLVGRRSGRRYEAPLLAEQAGDGFVISLPYGAGVEWCRNILAAGELDLRRNGASYQVSHPVLVDRGEALAGLPLSRQLLFRLSGIRQYLRVR